MIDPCNIDDCTLMSERKFQEIAAQGLNGPFINVMEIQGRGWAIFGPFGVYQSAEGKRTFSDPAEVHGILKKWGMTRFVESGKLREFSGETWL